MKNLNKRNLWEENKNKKIKNNKTLDLKSIINKIKQIIIKYKHNNFIKKNKKKIIKIIIIFAISIWVISGFYIIKKNEIGILTRLGQFKKIIYPGIHWKITIIDKISKFNKTKNNQITILNTELTSDQNIIIIKIILKYNITNPKIYLYKIENINKYIKKTTESILFNTIINYNIEKILFTEKNKIQHIISNKIKNFFIYDNIGIKIKNVIFNNIQPPYKLNKLFNNVIIAKKNKKININKAIHFANKLKKKTHYQTINIINKSKIYKEYLINKAKKEMLNFNTMLSIYKLSPKIEKEKLYIETMEQILKNIPKIISKNKNILLLSTKQNVFNKEKKIKIKEKKIKSKEKKIITKKKKSNPLNNMVNQRINNTLRTNNRNIGNK